eukprot:13587803-Alexandrium_andersonii.AAC.1
MSASLVGSEMCIRDRGKHGKHGPAVRCVEQPGNDEGKQETELKPHGQFFRREHVLSERTNRLRSHP